VDGRHAGLTDFLFFVGDPSIENLRETGVGMGIIESPGFWALCRSSVLNRPLLLHPIENKSI